MPFIVSVTQASPLDRSVPRLTGSLTGSLTAPRRTYSRSLAQSVPPAKGSRGII
jgi:hypothetical protein